MPLPPFSSSHPRPSFLALSTTNNRRTTTPRDFLLLASGTVTAAFVVSHLYFLLKRKKPNLCSFLRMLGLGDTASSTHYYDPLTNKFSYPTTTRGPVTETLHGVQVADPYRWLEDPDAKPVQAWVEAQNKTTDAYFSAALKEDKEKFQAKMNELYHYDKYSCMWRKGERYFFYKKAGLENQHLLYTQDSLEGPARVLIDPTTLREDGTAALSSVHLTDDANTLAYMISLSGSDWQTIYVMDVATGKLLSDEVHWCKFSSVAWTKDGKGFFYARYPPPSSKGKEDGAGTETEAAASQKVYYHRLGSKEEEDVLFFEDLEHPKWLYGVETSEDGETLLLTSNDSCDPVNRLFYFDLRGFDGKDVKTIGRCVKLVDHLENKFDYLTNEGRVFYFRTNKDAPKYKVVKVVLPAVGDEKVETDPAALAKLNYEDVVPVDQTKGGVLMDAQVVAGKFLLLQYLRDVVDELELAPLEGGKTRVPVPLPGKGALESVCARKKHTEFFYKYTSFNDPGTVYRAEIKLPAAGVGGAPTVVAAVAAAAAAGGENSNEYSPSVSPTTGATSEGTGSANGGKAHKKKNKHGGKNKKNNTSTTASSTTNTTSSSSFSLLSQVEIPTSIIFRSHIPGLNPEEYSTTQIFYSSKDGTKVPMFLVQGKKETGTDTQTHTSPTFLYGYGGFNISIRPSFSLSRLLYIKHYGGVVAIANIRGGGEYGEEWHNGGTKQNKQNVFDDFIAAAEYLVKEGISIPAQIAINGGSNGGLLVAACINQRPDLFGAAVAQVGVLDMLRFHKFTIGYAWCSDYGNADDNEEDFVNLLKFSPVHNVNAGEGVVYPATLITTGDHDDRVVPLHSYKYIAALQYAQGEKTAQVESGRPLVIRIDTKAGHGAGKPTGKVIEEQCDVMAFIAKNTGAVWRE